MTGLLSKQESFSYWVTFGSFTVYKIFYIVNCHHNCLTKDYDLSVQLNFT